MKANKGAPGIDGITVDKIGAYLWDNQETMIERIYKGKYTPDPGRRAKDAIIKVKEYAKEGNRYVVSMVQST